MIYNTVNTLPILNYEDNLILLSDDEEYLQRQSIRQVMVAYKKYTEAQLALKARIEKAWARRRLGCSGLGGVGDGEAPDVRARRVLDCVSTVKLWLMERARRQRLGCSGLGGVGDIVETTAKLQMLEGRDGEVPVVRSSRARLQKCKEDGEAPGVWRGRRKSRDEEDAGDPEPKRLLLIVRVTIVLSRSMERTGYRRGHQCNQRE
ncbi:Uncharacterized protein FKW44_013838 [Caligus rogercresseyi]|uniref:Uncharacterized protein n=1 Tax=Caligus rogercresseyi TaxID=217165 RepID=A0A7T8JZI7_CALRO|nr:Uncharacterized protein FKW44_013838 [Caligus rogercresseyi]